MKELAIIILDWNGADDTIECLKSITNYKLYDIYLLDNGSKENNIEKVKDFFTKEMDPNLINIIDIDSFNNNSSSINYILSKDNLGFAAGNNYIANKICRLYEYVMLLNNDTVVSKGAIEHMVETAKKKKTTALTCDIRIYYNKNELWNAGGKFTFYGDRKYYSQKKIDVYKSKKISYINAEFITGCALIVSSEHIVQNGLFTEDFFHGEEDFNFCYNLHRKGLRMGVDLEAVIYHKVGRTMKRLSGTDHEINAMIVHYTNRVIDFKKFYSKNRWVIWRKIYLFLVYIRRVCTGLDKVITKKMIKAVVEISDTYNDVKKPVFDMIMSYKWNE